MTIHPPAGTPAPKDLLLDAEKQRKEYYTHLHHPAEVRL
jgi:hypothetical protein